MKKLTIIWLFLSLPFLGISQKVIVPWKVNISDTESYQNALDRGVSDAHLQALRDAGVNTKIHSFTSYAVSENNEDFEEVFNSEIFSDIGGIIDDWGYVSEPTKGFDIDLNSNTISFTIWAKVKKHTSSPDPSFKANIEWIHYTYKEDPITKDIQQIENKRLEPPSYKDGDYIDFEVKFFQDSYINIFYLSSEESVILYPIQELDKKYAQYANRLYHRGEKTRFDKKFGFRARTESLSEHAKLLIIITKKYYPYVKASRNKAKLLIKTDFESILRWVNDIEPKNRDEYFYDVIISKN